MTPKELDFFHKLIEDTAKAAYQHGYDEAKAGKPLNPDVFRMTAGNKLVLKKELNSFMKKR